MKNREIRKHKYLGGFILRMNFSYSSSMFCEKFTQLSDKNNKKNVGNGIQPLAIKGKIMEQGVRSK